MRGAEKALRRQAGTSLLGRVVFPGDCGMVTRYNFDDL
jgi:hypothetical protein